MVGAYWGSKKDRETVLGLGSLSLYLSPFCKLDQSFKPLR